MKNKLPENNSTRLASLDILRGFDLFLLVFFQPVFAALVRQMNLPFLNDILYQFDHEVWEGFRFWDLVMPLFLFMTGASMPFSLSRYIGTTGSYRPVYRRILRRVILLFVFGMIVQGNLLGLDSQHLYLYSNTLQSIAVGYFIAAVIQLHFPFKWQVGITLLLLLVYWIPMTFWAILHRREILRNKWTDASWVVSGTEYSGMRTEVGVSRHPTTIHGYGVA